MNSGDQPPNPEKDFAEKIIIAAIRWVPLGGVLGVFVDSLVRGEMMQAAVLFPVTVVTGIWAAYTENFLARSREIASNRGREDPDKIVNFFKEANSAVQWQLSGFQERYLWAQASACEEYSVEGYSKTGGWKLLLEEVYVPLEISSEALLGRFLKNSRIPRDLVALEGTQRETLYLWELLREVRRVPAYRQMAILAKGGFGKTTLLRHVTYRYATKPKQMSRRHRVPVLIPFLLYLRDWRGEIARRDAPDLPTLIHQQHVPNLPEGNRLKLPKNWAADVLQRGEALVMFDGFDEVADEQRIAVGQWVSRQMANYPRSVFILTSRPEGYEEYMRCPGVQRLSTIYVKPFSAKQRDKFIKSWYECQERYERGNRGTPAVRDIAERAANSLIVEIEERPELVSMAENPLMLNMIASFNRFSSGRLPERRTELYADICQMQLWDRPRAKHVEMLARPNVSRAILQRIALRMTHRPQPTVKLPVAEITQMVATYATQLTDDPIDAGEFVEQIKKVSELLAERDFREYEFSHRSFQDYLAACELAENRQEDLVISNLENQWWRETILLYAELVNPSKLIEAACERGTPIAIDVAYRCLQMGSNLTRVSPAIQAQLEVAQPLQAQLQGKRYAKLEALLKAREWKAADKETYELMIRTVGKDPGQFFSAEELRKFPCEDLLRIDGLWVKNSDGRFGFSIQKEIYVHECGGRLDGIEYDRESFSQLIEKVEWDRQLDYQIEPLGYLPGEWVVRNFRSGWTRSLFSLLSRVQACEL